MATQWQQTMASDPSRKVTLISSGYSTSKQSCIIYYKSENPPVATYFVEDMVTHAPYENDDCSLAQQNCAAAQTKSEAVFDELTKMPVNAKK